MLRTLIDRDQNAQPTPQFAGAGSSLDPEALHTQAKSSVRAPLNEGESANTIRSYASALRYWAAWFCLRYRAALALPRPTPAVLQFVADHVERTTDDGSPAHDLPAAIDHTLVAAVPCSWMKSAICRRPCRPGLLRVLAEGDFYRVAPSALGNQHLPDGGSRHVVVAIGVAHI